MADRTCPFPGCGKPIESSVFCCRTHWASLTEDDRKTIWSAWHNYQARKVTLARLREVQAEVIGRYARGGREVQDDRKRLECLALLAECFLAKDAEYRKCKEQMLDAKARLGKEHRRLKSQLDEMIGEILHPDNGQRALFDNTAPERGETNLPD